MGLAPAASGCPRQDRDRGHARRCDGEDVSARGCESPRLHSNEQGPGIARALFIGMTFERSPLRRLPLVLESAPARTAPEAAAASSRRSKNERSRLRPLPLVVSASTSAERSEARAGWRRLRQSCRVASPLVMVDSNTPRTPRLQSEGTARIRGRYYPCCAGRSCHTAPPAPSIIVRSGSAPLRLRGRTKTGPSPRAQSVRGSPNGFHHQRNRPQPAPPNARTPSETTALSRAPVARASRSARTGSPSSPSDPKARSRLQRHRRAWASSAQGRAGAAATRGSRRRADPRRIEGRGGRRGGFRFFERFVR